MTETWCFACYGAGYIKVSDINIVCPTCVGQGTLTKGEKQMSEEETTVTSVVLDGPLDAVQKEIERLKLDIEAEKVHASNYRQELFKLKEIVHNFFAEQFSDNEDEITVHRDEANELLGDIGADLLKQEFEGHVTITYSFTVKAESVEDAEEKVKNAVGSLEYSICEKICYAGKLEKVFKSTRELLLANWDAVQNKSVNELQQMIQFMIQDFKYDCDKYNAAKYFRIHWDGDFFSDDYTKAWRRVIKHNKDVQFWVYTRVPSAVDQDFGVKLAWLADTFEDASSQVRAITGRPGAKCPEQTRQIPLITKDGGACYTCGLCITNKTDIRFSISKT